MDYRTMIETMTPAVYENLKQAVETGKWPNGNTVTQAQRSEAMQAVIAWGKLHLPATEQVGYIDRGKKAGESCEDPGETTLKWRE